MDVRLTRDTRPKLDRQARRRLIVLLCLEAIVIGGLAGWLAYGLLVR